MKLTTKTRYAARALTQLASATAPITVHQLAECQDISEKYLESIMKALHSAGLVKATRGTRGGHELAKPAESITLCDVFEALEGPLRPVECVDDPTRCPRAGTCPTRDIWVQLKELILGFFEQTTLQQLAQRYEVKVSARPLDFEI